jgi:hypothetical protein
VGAPAPRSGVLRRACRLQCAAAGMGRGVWVRRRRRDDLVPRPGGRPKDAVVSDQVEPWRLTLRDGKVVWDLNGRSHGPWEKLPPFQNPIPPLRGGRLVP